jgi:hypothetical protein
MPDLVVGAKLIGSKGPLVDTKELKKRVARTNQKFAKRAKRSFQRTTRTWDHQPVFHQETSTAEMSVSVFTYDDIYRFLNDGTAIRYAVMTEDFSPKTRPGLLDSLPGSGRMARLDLDNPREGIEARDFSGMVEAKHGPEYQRAIEDDLDQVTRSGT